MSEIALSRVVAAPPERVWQVITDVARAPETLGGVTEVQLMTDGPYAVGTRWRETRTMMGRSVTEEMWVSACDPLRSTRVSAESGGARFATDFTLTPLEDGSRTELGVRFSAETSRTSGLRSLGMKLFAGMAARASRRALDQDLADIAAAAER